MTLNTSKTIIVVDDTRENLKLLTGMLSEQGYRVRIVPNGERALVSVQRERPDLILLDILMPGMDGFQVCRALKADERLRDIPVIFVSALDEVFDKVTAFSIGGVDYIQKPFQVEEVMARVRTQLSLRDEPTAPSPKSGVGGVRSYGGARSKKPVVKSDRLYGSVDYGRGCA